MHTPNIFDRAIVVLEKRGWCQRRSEDSQGRVCAQYAMVLGVVAPHIPEALDKTPAKTMESVTAWHRAIAEVCAVQTWLAQTFGVRSVPYFNDTRGRTVEDVIKLFRQASARWEAERTEQPEPIEGEGSPFVIHSETINVATAQINAFKTAWGSPLPEHLYASVA